MYSRTDKSTFNYTKWGVGNLSMCDVYLQFAHLAEEMIPYCRWKGMPCSHEDFRLTLTDGGVCFTFNARFSRDSIINATGVNHGLQLVVNVEQYEHMKGPHNAVGLKLLLHRQGAVPLMEDFGENVPVGMHTFVGVSITNAQAQVQAQAVHILNITSLYFDRYSQAACYRECLTDFVVDKCHCRDYYMPSVYTDEPPVCNVSQHTMCLLPAIESFNRKLSVACVCPKECDVLHYQTSSSLNIKNQFDLSVKYLNRTSKHLNDSLDTKELIFPERRRPNIQEAETILPGRPTRNLSKEALSVQDLISFKNKMESFLEMARMDGTFFSRNFLELNIYMRDLRVHKHEQLEAYTLIDILSTI
ncbi:hypothetical protein NP493_1354g00003 [Ridgeia piscesae]|uniref:Uncharacterized protein n=1 Tax=Ridgeia piscesae TaxID=27915 RepID=A0AAD9NES2_RIDPI|nr:hypothetical protein NP493_1354g00003 [Ridgeia piscesae]